MRTAEEYRFEEWRPVFGIPGYEVSSVGRVRSTKRILKLGSYQGYPRITLRLNKKTVVRPVHALVLEAFVCPRPPGMVSRHLDGERTHNNVSNLTWGTSQENSDDQRRHGTVMLGESHYRARLNDSAVTAMRWLHYVGRRQYRDLAAAYGVSSDCVKLLCTEGESGTWKHLRFPDAARNIMNKAGKERWCNICGTWKPLSDFYRSRTKRYGRGHVCKSCRNVVRRGDYVASR